MQVGPEPVPAVLSDPPRSMALMPLTPADIDMLALESQQWRFQSSKESAVWDRFGVSMFVYYRRVNTLLSSEAAEAHDPVAVHRLRRIRAARRR